MAEQRKPFGYKLMPVSEGRRQDFLFLRHYSDDLPSGGYWKMLMDLDDPRPESVLIFFHDSVSAEELMHEINRVQTYVRENTEKLP